MFDRFTEKARVVVFQARHEASVLFSGWIEVEHLLLGLLKEDKLLLRHLPGAALKAIRAQIEESLPQPERLISTSVDMPLSQGSQRALEYSVEEAGRLGHKLIDCCHLTLGLLRVEGCLAGSLLRKYGINSRSYRLIVLKTSVAQPSASRATQTLPPEPLQPPAPCMADAIANLENLVGRTRKHLKRYADAYGEQPLKRKPWTRKQALGHLVDWAGAHQVLFARALTEPKLIRGAYPADSWVPAQKYGDYLWQEIVDLWCSLHGLLIHVLAQIPEDKRELQCLIGAQEPIPLSQLIERYVEHCEDELGHILA